MTLPIPPDPDVPPGTPWVKSRWSDNIYSLRFRNFQELGNDLVAELEKDSSGAIHASMRVDKTMYEVNEGQSMDNWPDAAEAVLLRIAQFFQGRMKSGYITKFLPFSTDAQIQEAFGVSQSTASVWRRGKRVTRRGKDVAMKRQSINQILTALGFRFPRRGFEKFSGGRLRLADKMWSDEDELIAIELLKGKTAIESAKNPE